MLGRVVRLALLPAGPAHATPGTGEDANRVGVLAASVARLLVGPRVGVARGVSECDERLAQALVAGPSETAAARGFPDSRVTGTAPPSAAR